MRYIFKKYWYILLIALAVNIPLLIFTTVRTNKYIITKGGITNFSDIVKVDTDYKQEGSFSTIYVQDIEGTTLFMNWVASINSKTMEVNEKSKAQSSMSEQQYFISSSIQYDSSVYKSIITAYKYAQEKHPELNISIDYSFIGFMVTYYYPQESLFKTGDLITKITDKDGNVKASNKDEDGYRLFFSDFKNNYQDGDIFTIKRDNELIDVTPTESFSFSYSDYYQINSTTPSLNINESSVGGPSGGLLQSLSIYNQLVPEDLTHGLSIAGTGTISYDGKVGIIGGIKEKVPTALDNNIDIFLCVKANYDEALEAYNSLYGHEKMQLVEIEYFKDAVDYLEALE